MTMELTVMKGRSARAQCLPEPANRSSLRKNSWEDDVPSPFTRSPQAHQSIKVSEKPCSKGTGTPAASSALRCGWAGGLEAA